MAWVTSNTFLIVKLFKLEAQRVYFDVPQTGHEATSSHRPWADPGFRKTGGGSNVMYEARNETRSASGGGSCGRGIPFTTHLTFLDKTLEMV